ncbi:MAG: hypothetical protein EP326_11115 [Deltaproteobacteria bacterium]|nr:MAG: hypothetical protein EP326_11115 [Deltaproteobacteria bacterium]TNF29089.1 MAG: hypothetical protein EP319_07700 [Deltaproteobacteria bacterium]
MSKRCLLRFIYGTKNSNDQFYLLTGLGVLIGAWFWKQNERIEALGIVIFLALVGYVLSMKKKIEPDEVRIHENGIRIPQVCVETKSYEYDREVDENYNLVSIMAEHIEEDMSLRLSPNKRTFFEWKEIRKIQYNPTSTIFVLTGGDIIIVQHSQIPNQYLRGFISLVKEYVEKTGGIISKG